MIPLAHILGQDESLLVECQQGHKLLPDVCVAFSSMQQAAGQDGIDLQIVSSYRSFSRQQHIWHNKWSGKQAILDPNEVPLNTNNLSEQEKVFAILTWSALPGASRHHWGTDLDVYDKRSVENVEDKFQLVCSEYENEGPCSKLNQWLTKYAQDFEFTRPYNEYKGGVAQEPWHLSYLPIANIVESQLTKQSILDTLINSKMLGLAAITENIDEIFTRFVLNKGLS